MPPLRLTSLLHTALPNLSTQSRAVLSALACRNGVDLKAGEVASWIGLRDRYQLGRVLRRDGLPPFETLLGWARLIHWLHEAEASGSSLLRLAQRDHLHPAAAYRLVRRLTGNCWSELRQSGLPAALRRLREARRQAKPGSHGRGGGGGSATAISSAVERRAGRANPASKQRAFSGILGTRVAVHDGPFDVAITSTGIALVTCAHAALVELIALDRLQVIGALRTGAVPTRVHVSRSGRRAYVTAQFAEDVEVFDLETGGLEAAVPLPGHPLGAALSPDEHTLFVTTNTDRLLAINVGTRRVVGSAAIPMGSPQLSVHPAGHRVYVAGFTAGTVTECDASSLRVVRTFELGGITQDIVVAPSAAGGGTLFSANQSGWVDAVSLATGRRVARVDVGGAAMGLALDHGESALLVSLVFDGVICVLDPHSFVLRTRLRPGGKPRLMAFDPSGAGALVANEHGWVDHVL
jgi:DNA-binding beta-propeller fold protein YncE